MYFDVAYDGIKKNKNILLKNKELSYNYDEHLCYDYKVQKMLVILEDPENEEIRDEAEDAEDTVLKYTSNVEIVSPDEAETILKQYQKKNKGK
jgi:hypothetical protein